MLCLVFMLVQSIGHARVNVKEKWIVLVCSPVVSWLICFQACDLAVLRGREKAALESCLD